MADGCELVDTHCHLDLEPLAARAGELLADARMAGVRQIVVPGVHPDGWGRIERMVREFTGVRAAFGIHPMHADLVDDRVLAELEQRAMQAVALGETGLDPTCAVPMAVQEQAFRRQIRVALRCKLPLLVHCRKAFHRTLAILREENASRVGGIMHAFSGSPEMANEFIRIGFTVALSGVVTWDNAVRPVRLAREIPLEHLVLETDAPDMAPQCYRGQPNRPAWLREIASCVACIRGIEVRTLIEATTRTARRTLPKIGNPSR